MGDFSQAIVGLRARPEADIGAEHKFSGTGFLARAGEAVVIITCAHVARQADNQDDVWKFQIEGDKQIYYATLKHIDHTLDVAILSPISTLPHVEPLKLLSSDQSQGHQFSTFGYPQTDNYLGLHGAGQILGMVKDKQQRQAVQFNSTQVTHGFSGAPLWDEELQAVAGMVSSGFDFGLDKKLGDVGFAIPTEILKKVYADLVVGEAPAPPPPVTWNLKHPYGQQEHFTGRQPELAQLTHWLTADAAHPLLMVRALGGFGKSALAWHWLTRQVAHADFAYVLWWSFYEGDASFENFLTEALRYLLGEKAELPAGARPQAERLIDELRQRPNVLLILDGFERALRAFGGLGVMHQGDDAVSPIGDEGRDCISSAAEMFLRNLASLGDQVRGKVLMTTRLRPRIVEKHNQLLAGGSEIELNELAPEDAVAFFQAQRIRGTHAEIEAACRPYGFHPLSLRLLAGVVLNDLKHPSDIVVAQGLDIFEDLKQNQHHVLEVAYQRLPDIQRTLLGRISCFRSGVLYDAVKNIADTSEKDLDIALRGLMSWGFLQRYEATNSKIPFSVFDLHPIVRHYSYSRFAEPDRISIHARLRIYFGSLPKPSKLQEMKDLALLIEQYYHTVCSGRLDEGFLLFHDRINQAAYYQFGAYQLQIELLQALFLDGEDKPPRLNNEGARNWTLNELANSYSLNGQPSHAMTLFEQAVAGAEKLSDQENFTLGLGNLAHMAQIPTGRLNSAEANLRRKIAILRERGDNFNKAGGHLELSHVLTYCGQWR